MIRSVNRMGAKKLELGATGETVRENIAYLREKANLGFTEFSRQLESVGHSIPPLGLRRIENGERKVTVDDLAAIACILQCTPDYLMLPRAARDTRVKTTGWGHMTASSLFYLLNSGRVSFYDESDGESVEVILHSQPDWLLAMLDRNDPGYAELPGRAFKSTPDGKRDIEVKIDRQ